MSVICILAEIGARGRGKGHAGGRRKKRDDPDDDVKRLEICKRPVTVAGGPVVNVLDGMAGGGGDVSKLAVHAWHYISGWSRFSVDIRALYLKICVYVTLQMLLCCIDIL